MGGSWTYTSQSCVECGLILGKRHADGENYTIPKKLGQTIMNVSVCKECYRNWALEQILK